LDDDLGVSVGLRELLKCLRYTVDPDPTRNEWIDVDLAVCDQMQGLRELVGRVSQHELE
jgi:hypothetical protein